MKSSILLLTIAILALSSCTTAYKTGQTPDDVYFSPERPQDEYVKVDRRDNRRYQNDDEYYDNRYLRMKVNNRYRWNELNDWYSYERYGSGYNYLYGSYNNPYNSWNYYHNPYCPGTVIVNSTTNTAYSKPRVFNLNTYTPNTTAKTTNKSSGIYNYTGNNNNSNNNNINNNTRSSKSNSGTVLRDIFGSSNNNSSSRSTNTSSGNNNNSGSSSGSSSSETSKPASVRKF